MNIFAINSIQERGIMSNIANVFNPPKSEEIEDCLACDVFNSFFLVGAGSYLISGKAIQKDNKISLEEFHKKNPIWWRNSIKGFGAALIGYGAYRGYDTWRTTQKRIPLQ